MNSWKSCITTCFGLGLLPKAPGTWGSLGALFFWAALAQLTTGWLVYGTVLLAILALGTWATHLEGGEDRQSIVVDEWVGMGIALSTGTFSWPELIVGFALFRFFDIVKPLGIRCIDQKVKGAWGVMLDDVLAGIYSAIVLGFLVYLGVFNGFLASWQSY